MSQMQIKDANNQVQLVAKVVNTGQTNRMESMPVTIATEDIAALAPQNGSMNSGNSDATTQRVVTASNSPDVVSLASIDTKLPASVGGNIPVVLSSANITSLTEIKESVGAGVIDSTTTRTVAASNSPDVVSLASIDTKMPAQLLNSTPVIIRNRVCLGTARLTVPTGSAVTLASATGGIAIPAGSLTAELQADGGTIRLRRDNGTPTATLGYRLDDGIEKIVDSTLSQVQLIAQSANTFCNVAYFDRV